MTLLTFFFVVSVIDGHLTFLVFLITQGGIVHMIILHVHP